MAISKISLLSLEELYQRKITPSIEREIIAKEDFSNLAPDYCNTVCKLKCKTPKEVRLLTQEVDILIIQDHAAPKGKWDRKDNGQELIQQSIINFICEKAGFTGLNYRIVNLLKCKPTEIDFPRGKAPSVTTLKKCAPYLAQEIKVGKPKVIISLSTAVTKALGYTKHSNTGNRGEVVDGNVVITLHPRVLSMIRQNASGKMWGNDYFEIIRRDFEKAAKIARGELVVKTLTQGLEEQRENVTVCKSLPEVQEAVRILCDLPEGTVISCDTETTGLDPMSPTAKLLCIQFGYRDPKDGIIKALVIPLWHRTNKYFNPDVAWKLVVPLLISEEIPKIYHNGKFDILYIYHTKNVRCKGTMFDTMLMLHALDSGIQGCLSLKAAIWDWGIELGIGGYENLLPGLTKAPKPKKDGDGEEEEDEEENGED